MKPNGVRHFLDLDEIAVADLRAMLANSRAMKARVKKGDHSDKPLAGKTLAMIFDKPSTRTRVSFDVAMRQLGGEAIMLTGQEMQLGRGETIADTAKVLSRYVDAIVIRTLDPKALDELARHATVPVINGLTDFSHPCQLLADMQTVIETRAKLAGSRWAWIGDGNNVCNSLIEAAALMHFGLAVATPSQFEPDVGMCAMAATRDDIYFGCDPTEAIDGAEVVATDAWVSMGQEHDDYREEAFAGFQVDEALMARAAPGATFLHCLPAHRGEEVSDAVIDGAQSAVWDEAENRLHAQKALLMWVMGKLG